MKTLITSLFLFVVLNSNAQITFDTSKPIDSLIQDFVGAGVAISNVTFIGGAQSIGSFNGSSSLISSQGIVFTTGTIDSSISTAASNFLSTGLSLSGDADLNLLLNATPTFDAAVLEFDFVATNNTLLFDYVFASEEYNEFVGSSFNDVFAFYISGPGILGKQNIALLPSSGISVAINNVNIGSFGNGPCVNCSYFHDNSNDTTVAFDGFTVPLTATFALTPGQTYHLKLAVADAADGVFDTGVFLQKYSLRSVGTAAVAENVLEKSNVYLDGNLLHIDLLNNAAAKVSVYNIIGAILVESKTNSSTNTFDVSSFKPGVYYVVLEWNGASFIKKIVIQ